MFIFAICEQSFHLLLVALLEHCGLAVLNQVESPESYCDEKIDSKLEVLCFEKFTERQQSSDVGYLVRLKAKFH